MINLSRRKVAIIAIIVALCIFIAIVAIRQKAASDVASAASVNYTNAITGESSTDIVGQTDDLRPGTISAASVTIDGIDALYNFLTTDQGVSAQDTMNDFLFAHSGLQSVSAGIEENSLTSSGDTLTFILVIVQPQARYRVTIKTASASQSIPVVTFEQVGQ